MTVLGVDAAVVIGVVVVVAAVAVLLLVLAPWKGVRDERPLDDEVEARLLLGEDPDAIAADVDAAETARAPVVDLDLDAERRQAADSGDDDGADR